MRSRLSAVRCLSVACMLMASVSAAVAIAEPGSGHADRTDRSTRDAARDAARSEERAARDAADAQRNLIRATEDRARREADLARDIARAEADIAEQQARAAEDAAEDAARAAEEAARDAADAAEEAAKQAEDAAEDAADAAEDAAEDALRSGAGSLRELVADQNPELDDGGFPVRRAEVVALDISAPALASARASGFRVLEMVDLGDRAGQLTRLAVPEGMAARDAVRQLRMADSAGTYDLAHFYGTQFAAAGRMVGGTAVARRRTAQRFTVGMIDTGVNGGALGSGIRVTARNFAPAAASTELPGHGTAVASILARDGAAHLLAANVFSGASGRSHASADGIVRALGWLMQSDVAVINISLAGPRNLILDRLIGRALAQGQIIVAAAGNDGPAAPPAYPAATPDVVAVTATDTTNHVYRYAGRGPHIRFAAQGVAVPATTAAGQLALHSGTSFAAPHVSATLALCVERVGRRAAAACVTALERLAVDLGDAGRDPVYGFGLVR